MGKKDQMEWLEFCSMLYFNYECYVVGILGIPSGFLKFLS